jgi:3-hydroxy-9,10-secoandrosta-1,3,5(10)-triene-9,17-dione monooxygenase reductase component
MLKGQAMNFAQIMRDVLGELPTGVCVITAQNTKGGRHGVVVGSFTSISLDPALVGFFIGAGSTSWPLIEATGRFCVNVLAADQLSVCKRFSARGADKFADLQYGQSPSGQPVLENSLAWIDCALDRVISIGDHMLVVGLVDNLGKQGSGEPLVFFRRDFHRLSALAEI